MVSEMKYICKSLRQKVFDMKYSMSSSINVLLYLFFKAFESMASGLPLNIPSEIEAKYVKFAEEIVSISYTQSEKFSSVSIKIIK